MVIAETEGLLEGERTQVVRGRMPEALVTRAKKRTGIDSDTELIEVALANIAVAKHRMQLKNSKRIGASVHWNDESSTRQAALRHDGLH